MLRCYSGYHRLRDRLDDNAQRRALDWRRLSLPYDAHDSTLWLGSAGAYTPTHQDTYGFNVHAQLDGDKLWVLFPPDDARQLRATRLPYEESSVFRCIRIACASRLCYIAADSAVWIYCRRRNRCAPVVRT